MPYDSETESFQLNICITNQIFFTILAQQRRKPTTVYWVSSSQKKKSSSPRRNFCTKWHGRQFISSPKWERASQKNIFKSFAEKILKPRNFSWIGHGGFSALCHFHILVSVCVCDVNSQRNELCSSEDCNTSMLIWKYQTLFFPHKTSSSHGLLL